MSPRLGASRLRRLCLLAGLTLIAVLGVVQVASAATISYDSGAGKLTFTAAAGENNGLSVEQTGTHSVELIENDLPSVTIDPTANGNCSQPDSSAPYIVDCTTVNSVRALLGDGNDSYFVDESVTDLTLPEDVQGGDGLDNISTGSGNDTLDGGTGDDTLDGGAGSDALTGDSGYDYLYDTDTSAGDSLSGGDDDDSFYMGSDANGTGSIDGGAGTDFLDYSDRASGVTVDLLTAHSGGQTGMASDLDTITAIEDVNGSSTGSNALTGDDGPNHLDGGDGNDTITGNGGDDTLYGGAANDALTGGAGNDTLQGANGIDTLDGGSDNDELHGGDGGDTINGGTGNDEIDPGSHFTTNAFSDGADTIDGGDGTDWVQYYDRVAPLTIDLRGTTGSPTTNNGESGEHDSIANIENVTGGSAGDNITGNDGPNQIDDGTGASDVVNALGGNDSIYTADNQADTVDCGDGTDNIEADVTGEFHATVSDALSNCESVNADYVAPVDQNQNQNQNPTPTPSSTPTPTPTPAPTPAPQITPGAFFAKTLLSPKADTVFGAASIAVDGSRLEVDVFYNGKLAKLNLVGKLVKTNLKKGVVPFQVKLNKKAKKLAKKKGKKGFPVTVKVTIKPPSGASTVKTFKVVLKKGKTPACRATVRAHASC
jgi:Ca2+-binding RTX toxin-like protein